MIRRLDAVHRWERVQVDDQCERECGEPSGQELGLDPLPCPLPSPGDARPSLGWGKGWRTSEGSRATGGLQQREEAGYKGEDVREVLPRKGQGSFMIKEKG